MTGPVAPAAVDEPAAADDLQVRRERLGAALLAAGRPLSTAEIGTLLQLPPPQAAAAVSEYAAQLERARLGFLVEAVAGGYRLVVPPPLARQLAPLLAPPALPPLSGAALEVLAVVAYRQPVTRAEIEAMRGGSAGTLLTLQERELVKVTGKSAALGQPLLYGTTARFLLEFGLDGLDGLPLLDQPEFSHLLRG